MWIYTSPELLALCSQFNMISTAWYCEQVLTRRDFSLTAADSVPSERGDFPKPIRECRETQLALQGHLCFL